VPDWPNTYGYNLFLYPWETWVFGPWKLFIEHGHRLLGTLVGLITIGLLVSAFWCRQRPLVRWLGVAALAGVLFQGVLGGMRVIAADIQLAQVHGIVGPTFFAFTVALAAVTSKRWREAKRRDDPAPARIERLAIVTLGLAFLQLVLGSQLRHLGAEARPSDFRIALFFHLAVAAALWFHVVLLAIRAWRTTRGESWLTRPATGLVLAICAQLALGAGTWVSKYGWPAWMSGFDFAAAYRPTADSAGQTSMATAHVAIGAMILASTLLVALRAGRLAARGPTRHGQPLAMEAAR
jgi:cytochrome c oxidase assembly protein subunit 15